jgi:hypothetical protein
MVSFPEDRNPHSEKMLLFLTDLEIDWNEGKVVVTLCLR